MDDVTRKPDAAEVEPAPCAHEGAPSAPPCTIVIFGATGDLTGRLLMPALSNLAGDKLLDEKTSIIGIGRRGDDDAGFRKALSLSIDEDARVKGEGTPDMRGWAFVRERVFYLAGEFRDDALYERLKASLEEHAKRNGSGNTLFYLATAPEFFGDIIEKLGEAGLVGQGESGFRRVIIEKPFGVDLPSAVALNARILRQLDESQIYRIDHFLGKETVQNIIAFRFANVMFEPIWNRQFIDHVQVTAAETVTVETRGRFYEQTGALCDMIPNHMFQLLAMTTIEAPNSFDADAVRSEKARAIDAIKPLTLAQVRTDVVRGQYAAGAVKGRAVDAYREAADVARDSTTETYVAMKFSIDNWRWAGVPFYIRTGKAMAERRTEIVVQFKHAPFSLFPHMPVETISPNRLIIHVQPNEGITMKFEAKEPGPSMALSKVGMQFRYGDYFKLAPSTGYETLVYDCLIGDATLFQRADNIEAGWRAVQPILEAWKAGEPAPEFYAAGSWGPAGADALLARDGRTWRNG